MRNNFLNIAHIAVSFKSPRCTANPISAHGNKLFRKAMFSAAISRTLPGLKSFNGTHNDIASQTFYITQGTSNNYYRFDANGNLLETIQATLNGSSFDFSTGDTTSINNAFYIIPLDIRVVDDDGSESLSQIKFELEDTIEGDNVVDGAVLYYKGNVLADGQVIQFVPEAGASPINAKVSISGQTWTIDFLVDANGNQSPMANNDLEIIISNDFSLSVNGFEQQADFSVKVFATSQETASNNDSATSMISYTITPKSPLSIANDDNVSIDESSIDFCDNGHVIVPSSVTGNVLNNDDFSSSPAGTPPIVDVNYPTINPPLGPATKDTSVPGIITFTANDNSWQMVFEEDGDFTFTLNSRINHIDTQSENTVTSFTYTVRNAAGQTDTAILNVAIVDDIPMALDDNFNLLTNKTITGNVLLNDIPGADAPVTAGSLSLTGTNGGTLNLVANGNFEYTSSTSTGVDTFTYTITDRDGDTSTATISFDVKSSSDIAGVEVLKNTSDDLDAGTITANPLFPNINDPANRPVRASRTGAFNPLFNTNIFVATAFADILTGDSLNHLSSINSFRDASTSNSVTWGNDVLTGDSNPALGVGSDKFTFALDVPTGEGMAMQGIDRITDLDLLGGDILRFTNVIDAESDSDSDIDVNDLDAASIFVDIPNYDNDTGVDKGAIAIVFHDPTLGANPVAITGHAPLTDSTNASEIITALEALPDARGGIIIEDAPLGTVMGETSFAGIESTFGSIDIF